MKPNELINIALSIAILIIIGLAVKMIFFPSDHIVDKTVVKRDSTTKIEKNITQKHIEKKNVKATIISSGKHFKAISDVVIDNDSNAVKVSYDSETKSFDVIADIKEKTITIYKTITETVTVTVEKPIYEQWTFWSTIAAVLLFFLLK